MADIKDKLQQLIQGYIGQLCKQHLSHDAQGFTGQLQFSMLTRDDFNIFFDERIQYEDTALAPGIKTEEEDCFDNDSNYSPPYDSTGHMGNEDKEVNEDFYDDKSDRTHKEVWRFASRSEILLLYSMS